MAKRKFEPAFENLPMDQIIGAPLKATASANSMMAREQVQFLMDYCFKKEGDGYQPIMVEMAMTRSQLDPDDKSGVPKIKQYVTKFNLPLLTLIPLNSLSVEKFEIDFDMEVTSLEQNHSKSDSMNSNDSQKEKQSEVKFMGKVSNKDQQTSSSQYERRINSKLSINVKGGQQPLPVGLTSIIDLFSKNMEPVDMREKETSTEPKPIDIN